MRGLIFFILMLTISILFFTSREFENRSKSKGFEMKIQELAKVKSSLDELRIYIDAQESNLLETERILSSLQNEKKELDSLLTISRPEAELLFTTQREYDSKRRWMELTISFLIGFMASMLANVTPKIYRSVKVKLMKENG